MAEEATRAFGKSGFSTSMDSKMTLKPADCAAFTRSQVAGLWIALWPLSAGLWHAGADPWLFPWPGWVGAFVLFRVFDILKPGPVGWADRHDGAFGVMLDDVIAGAIAAVLIAIGAVVAHGMIGI